MKKRVFIDGEAGTTGLQVREKLANHPEIEILFIDPEKRKDKGARKVLLNSADAVFLCLPNQAAIDSVALLENSKTVIIDASTAHRTTPGWVYGFAEMTKTQRHSIASSKRIANPGCYPQGIIAVIRPFVTSGLLQPDVPLQAYAVSGYSGGGRRMIEQYEKDANPAPFMPYGLTFMHKHLPEMRTYGCLSRDPLFLPSVGNYAQGMLTSVALSYEAFTSRITGEQVHALLSEAYSTESFVEVAPFEAVERTGQLNPQSLNGTNRMRLFVFADDQKGQLLLFGVYDNLGKGASGAAIQNMNIALGFEETMGII